MGLRERIGDWISGGALSNARHVESVLKDILGIDNYKYDIEETVNLAYHIQKELTEKGWLRISNNDVGDQPDRDVIDTFGATAAKFWLHDGIVNCGIRQRSDFVLGVGFAMPTARKLGSEDVVEPAQSAIKDMWRHPYNQRTTFSTTAQKRADNALLIYGNSFILAKPDPKAVFRLRYLYPTEVTDVIIDPDDGITPVWFIREYTPLKYDEDGRIGNVNGKQVRIAYRCYASENGVLEDDYADSLFPKNCKRGIGSILHRMSMALPWWSWGVSSLSPVLQWASMLRDLKIGQAALVRAAQSMPVIEQLSGTSYQQSQHAARAKSDWSPSASGMSVPPAPGSVRIQGPNRQIQFVDTPTRAGEAQTNSSLLLKHVSAGLGFPPHYFGDMSEANLATATSLELPVKVMVESLYAETGEFMSQLAWMAIRARFGTGSVGYSEDDIYVNVGKPNISREDITAIANALSMFLPNNLITEETAARTSLETLGVTGVEHEISQLRPRWEEEREYREELRKAQLEPSDNPQPGNVAPGKPGSARSRANNARVQTMAKAGTLAKAQRGT